MQKQATQPADKTSTNAESIVAGTVFGLGAAFGYTAASISLRSAISVDPYWVSCVKAMPTLIFFGPWLLVLAAKSRRLVPGPRPLALLVIAAILGQVGGNVVFQVALGLIGIALTVPLCLGAMILTGAWLGWLVLGERLNVRTLLSIFVLVAAVAVLSLGAPAAHATLEIAASHNPQEVILGVAAACCSGVSYALLGVAIRNGAKHGCPEATMLVVVGLAGVIILLPVSVARIGVEAMLNTDRTMLLWMASAGFANALAFLALTKSLRLVGVVYVNALNATQAAMAAVAGVILFAEPLSAALGLGVALTAGGLLLMKKRVNKTPNPKS